MSCEEMHLTTYAYMYLTCLQEAEGNFKNFKDLFFFYQISFENRPILQNYFYSIWYV